MLNTRIFVTLAATCALSAGAQAQGVTSAPTAWQACAGLSADGAARLACFDQWAAQQGAAPLTSPPALASDMPDLPRASTPPDRPAALAVAAPLPHNCRGSGLSELSRFWELETGSDCGTFAIRSYRPLTLSWIGSDSVNEQPSSTAPNHTAATATAYTPNETRIQLSVRTKIAQGLLTHGQSQRRDSLWFGYTQQSHWQLFNGELSRPFRTTDHEPEITYVFPTDAALPGGWRLRYSGVSLVHQSNGQSLPLSRSWNRAVLMAGMEKDRQFRLTGKVWKRVNENATEDDNPGITSYLGRAELAGFWTVNDSNTLGVTLRHSLRADSKGSVRLEWLRAIVDSDLPGERSGLRFHTQLFTGYGDSLVDFNRRRTVLNIGLSLLDW
jgi:phospholipase A1